ncbi:Lactate/2-hydroxyacid dehydrogenase [Candidatus Hepatincolaceae symbiont of Richtersius coronifer]
MFKLAVFSSKPYVKDMFNTYNQNSDFDIVYLKENLNSNTAYLAKGFENVCLFVNDFADKETLKILKDSGCKLIALRCAGFNNVDIITAKEMSLPVVRVTAYSPYAVAEHAFSLLLSLNRKIHRAYQRGRNGNFSIDGLLGFDLHGKVMGVIGTGKIGLIFIKIALGFGMKVKAYDLYPKLEEAKSLGFDYVALDDLYKDSDIIALHCPLTPLNYHLINADAIEKMKDNVYIINTSRGGLIKTIDLIDSLKNNKIGAVGLDVYEEEEKYFFEDLSLQPGIQDDILSRLLSFKNVIITAHQAFFTKEALDKITSTTFENIKAYHEQNVLLNSVY